MSARQGSELRFLFLHFSVHKVVEIPRNHQIQHELHMKYRIQQHGGLKLRARHAVAHPQATKTHRGVSASPAKGTYHDKTVQNTE